LLIISAVLSFVSIPLMINYMDSVDFSSYSSVRFNTFYLFKDIFHYIAGFLVVMGVVAVLGGLTAIFRGNFWWARAGGIASVFSLAGAIGFAGLILIYASKNEFKRSLTAEHGGLGPQEPRSPGAARAEGEYRGPSEESLRKSLFVGR